MIRAIFLLVAALVCSLIAKDLPIGPDNYTINFTKYSFIDSTLNVIQFPNGKESFEHFFNKLDTLVFENKGQVRILHIGGSHLQADVISGRIREHLIKEYPGASAGRGFVFPYSAAKTNTPSSYASYYKGIWDKNRNIQKEVTKPLGLLGIAVSTSDPRAEISLLLDRYNSEPMWGETRFRLFGFSDNNDVVPVLRVDSSDIYGTLDTASQSYVFNSPRPIDSIHIQFRWMDSLQQAAVAQFITDSLFQDSVARANADSTQKDSAAGNASAAGANPAGAAGNSTTTANANGTDSEKQKAAIPGNVMQMMEVARDSMFQGDCDLLDTACMSKGDAVPTQAALPQVNSANANPAETNPASGKPANNQPASSKSDDAKNAPVDLANKDGVRKCSEVAAQAEAAASADSTNAVNDHCIPDEVAIPDSVKKHARPRFTLTGILAETDNPGITYTGVGINGAKVHDYFEEICPNFEKEMEFYKPDLVIFAIGINDANVQNFNDKQFIEDYSRLVARIKRVSPDAAIIFETNNDMYRKVKKRRYVQHPNGDIARKAFFTLAEKHSAGVWDKFSIMGGLGSMAKWEKASLAKSDKVHFNLSGYNLLGDMFYKALIDAYQEHIANLPAQKPAPLK